MEFFVDSQSVVRKIWGKSDTILFIFAGAAAEFALNKAVDWLYFTGRLPADPIGRLFSTVMYARQIVFSEKEKAMQAIDKITSIHQGVEKNRGTQIPDWAYRDVLFMLIHYSVASFELLERRLSDEEKEEVFDVFYRVGSRMNLSKLPTSYAAWKQQHQQQMQEDLVKSDFTIDLFKQYKKHLGAFRYKILLEAQKLVIPEHVRKLMGFSRINWVSPLLAFYKFSRLIRMDEVFKSLLLPPAYKKQIKELDIVS
jgi:uncharacterized protein (DUF2236 family)